VLRPVRTPVIVALLSFASLGASSVACGGPPAIVPAPAPSSAPHAEEDEGQAPGETTRFATHPRVGVYVSNPWTFTTSAYWIEGPRGVVLIDTGFLPSVATEILEGAEKATGKKVELAIVLHANPDKFNGTATMQARGVKVVTSAQVLAAMPPVHEKRVKAFGARYAPEYPTTLPAPESFGAATTTLEAGGLTLKAHVLGPGCSEAHVAVEWEGHLFVGDLVANGTHSWLEIGKTDEWLKRIDELAALKPKFVHPGRGAPGGPELLANERTYLEAVIAAVAAENPVLPAPEGALDRVKANLKQTYPDLGFPVFLNIGLPAEWARQARARAAAPAP
jgi:glyoxylase-like metal-dependent hydrolase (beta-lactamase superfamily II)